MGFVQTVNPVIESQTVDVDPDAGGRRAQEVTGEEDRDRRE